MAINGTNGDDEFRGTIFADEINGLGGDDMVFASPGGDTINGGNDNDTVDYQRFFPHAGASLSALGIQSDAVDVDLQRSVQSDGYAEGDVLISIENVTGSAFDDVIRGNGEDNILAGASGSDFIEGRDGDDLLDGDGNPLGILYLDNNDGPGDDHLDGGAGDDVIRGGGGQDTLIGGLDNDELSGDAGSDLLIGGTGFNTVDGGAGTDTTSYAASSAGMFVTIGSASGVGNGIAFSSDGQIGDSLFAIENVTGSNFADQIIGSSADNVLRGGRGNDTLDGRGGANTLDGGNGVDTVTYVAASSTVIVNLTLGAALGGGSSNDTLISIENATGSNFADFLIGNSGANVLNGGGGADTLTGAGGLDTLTGGTGADKFVWRDTSETGAVANTADVIIDFNPAESDRIDLSVIDANILVAGNQAFTFIGESAFTGAQGEVNVIFVNGDTIIQMQTGVEVDSDASIRIPGIVTLDASMFIL
jgi:Ca2+-binding RTX toxin-like protein